MSFKEKFAEKKEKVKEKLVEKREHFSDFLVDHPIATKVIFWETVIIMLVSASAQREINENKIKARKFDELTDEKTNVYDDYEVYQLEWEENYKDKYEACEKLLENLKLDDGEVISFSEDGFEYIKDGIEIIPPEDLP